MKKLLTAATAFLIIFSTCGCETILNKQNDIPTMAEVTESTVNIKAAGDNMMHTELLKYAKNSDGEYNFDFMYANIKDYIQSADIAVINEEAPIVSDNKRVSGYPSFGVPESMSNTLINTGFDVILQANNHITDKEESGIISSIETWKKHSNVTYLGIHDSEADAKKIRYVEANSIKIAMLNYTYGVNRDTWPSEGNEYMVDIADKDKIESDIASAKKNSDITIVFLHAGEEYTTTPSEEQENWINHCIDNGAGIVICAHPHVIQSYKAITTPRGNKGLVYYSLGNFISGQKKFETILGGVADLTLKKETAADGSSTIQVTEYGLEPVVTHTVKKDKLCEVYKLKDYTDELAAASDMAKSKKDFSTQSLWELYNSVVKEESDN